MKATAIAHANVALVKYWGKSDPSRNIPAVGSISLTLSQLWTRTSVAFRKDLEKDTLSLNGKPVSRSALKRVVGFLNYLRQRFPIDGHLKIESINNFPTGFAALALAASHAIGHPLPSAQTSELARLGSASAARSIFGGFVELPAGGDRDDAPTAIQIADEKHWSLAVLVAVTDESPKPMGSRAAMLQTQDRSPFFKAWVDAAPSDLDAMRSAVLERDFDAMGALAEHSALKLHGLIMSTRPGLVYWNPGTVAVIEAIRNMRREGLGVYFTIDAGPQVKAICRMGDQAAVADRLNALADVKSVIASRPGPSAYIVEET